jgi:putative transposase
MRLLKKIRVKAKRKPSPTYGLIDSQSAKTALASDDRGFDGGKKVKGRKRHIVTDIMGNLLAVSVHAANIHDSKSGITPAKKAFAKYPTIKKFCGDCGYRKTFIADVKSELGLDVDISPKILPQDGVSPKRWIVERAFAWANHSRRLSKDYEISTDSAENMFMVSHIAILLRRF